MRKLLRYAKRYWGYVITAALAGAGCSAVNVWIVDLLRQMIDESLGGRLFVVLPTAAVKIVLLIVVGMLANYLVISMTGLFGAGVLKDLRRDLADHIMKMTPDFMERHNFGDVIERASSDVDEIANYMQNYFKDCLYVPIVVMCFAIYLILLNPLIAAVCIGPLLVMVPLSVKLLKPVKMAQADYVRRLGLTNNNIQEVFDGADAVKAYGLEETLRSKYVRALRETFDISNRNDLRQYNLEPLSCLIREAPRAAALCAGGFLVFQGDMTLGILIAFISGIEKLNEPLAGAYQLVVRTQLAMISVKRVFEIMDQPIEETGGAEEIEQADEAVFSFQDVSFAYANMHSSQKKALAHVNLSVERGKRVALVGRSGCGKSTIIKLMCRHYEADTGEIRFCGKRFAKLSPEAVRENLALISQQTVIFPMSVSDNIRIGRPEACRAEIVEAAKLAGCHGFISELPDGYDTLLEEQGSNLSGGQRQRICIARAILKDAPVLLLDEPTSALDRENEKLVSETLARIAADKTVVTVAHRLTTITDYDEIIVLEDGRIAESGTHDTLLQAGGIYCQMYHAYMASEVMEH